MHGGSQQLLVAAVERLSAPQPPQPAQLAAAAAAAAAAVDGA